MYKPFSIEEIIDASTLKMIVPQRMVEQEAEIFFLFLPVNTAICGLLMFNMLSYFTA